MNDTDKIFLYAFPSFHNKITFFVNIFFDEICSSNLQFRKTKLKSGLDRIDINSPVALTFYFILYFFAFNFKFFKPCQSLFCLSLTESLRNN